MALRPNTGKEAEALAFRSVEDVVFVDVGDRVIDSQVVRDGVDVGRFDIDEDRLDLEIGGRKPIVQRVVSQSIEAGTSVAVGTTIDLVFAPTKGFPAGIVNGVLLGLRDETFGDVFTRFVEGKSSIERIIARFGEDDVLPAEEEAAVKAVFAEEGIDLDETTGNDIPAAMRTLRAARTFGG